MKPRIENIISIRLTQLLAALFLILVSGSCHNKIKTNAEHKNLIPENEFISILTDAYITDGLLSLPEIRSKFSSRDSVSNYIDIIEDHGYTYEAFNSTVKYYFIMKPKKLMQATLQA